MGVGSEERGIADLMIASLRARGLRARVAVHRTAAGAWLAVCSIDTVVDGPARDHRSRSSNLAQELGQSIPRKFADALMSVSREFQESACASGAPFDDSRSSTAVCVAAARLRATIAARKAESQHPLGGNDQVRTLSDPVADAGSEAESASDTVGYVARWRSVWREHEDAEFALVDYSQTAGVGSPL